MRGRAGNPGRGIHPDGGRGPAHIGDVGGAAAGAGGLWVEGHDQSGGLDGGGFAEEGFANLGGEGFFFVGVGDAADRLEVGVHGAGEGFVAEEFVDAAGNFPFDRGASAERGTLGGFRDAIPDLGDDLSARTADVVVGFGEGGDDVGGFAAFGNHVMDTGRVGHMFAHQVNHMIHRFDAIEGGAAAVGGGGGVGGDPAEAELTGDVGEGAGEADGVAVAGVPVHDGVDVVEEAGADHVNFAGAALFGGCAVDAEGALLAGGLEPVLQRDGGVRGGGAEEVVAAGVARVDLGAGFFLGVGGLRDAGERVVFGEDADDG